MTMYGKSRSSSRPWGRPTWVFRVAVSAQVGVLLDCSASSSSMLPRAACRDRRRGVDGVEGRLRQAGCGCTKAKGTGERGRLACRPEASNDRRCRLRRIDYSVPLRRIIPVVVAL